MIEIIIWLSALLCPNPNHTAANHGDCPLPHGTVTTSSFDTGETGGTPKPPVPPPPPPPVGGQ
ncbi:MAG: hypothetical protein EOO06_16100 [Chitinophagaceae bacterium]|nr:MAG: hypothetical protein EOO06_16100 [Chitinophagaceae bacterium]